MEIATQGMTADGAAAGSGMRRRGLIAGAATLAASLLATRASGPVSAANGANLILGNNDDVANAATATTNLDVSGLPTNAGQGGLRVKVNNNTALPLAPDQTNDAIQGFANNPVPNTTPPIVSNAGVHGRNDDLNGIGAAGVASNGTGVYGQSTSGTGVGGLSTSGPGVYGTSTTNHGVSGFASGSGSGFITAGLFGTSNTTYGIIGNTTAPFYSGLTATTSTANCAALAATSTNANAYASYFTGKVVVEGDFFVVKHGDGSGGGKFAAVAHADGSYRGVYCMEAPEPWFEDFGEGTLTNGKAEIKLDPEFAGLVQTGGYHVFLTGHAAHQTLAVTQRTATAFVVEGTAMAAGASQGTALAVGATPGAAQGTFSWRLVGKRADIKGVRLPKVELPKLKQLDESKLAPHVVGGAPSPLPPRRP